ncbi:MAG: hypothetical protein PHC29_02840 [Candidatus Omnitrophica bacterium]|nr:hypothetical protein [Candidatus Omnitrophota bacterium]
MNKYFVSVSAFYLAAVFLSGCSTVKEMGKGFIGVSTQVLEDKRKDAVKKSFALGYNDCYTKVKDILAQGNIPPYIYSEDPKKKMIAIYLSQADTTPVGIFFTEEAGVNTLVEISSPSTYAKEEIANRIFTGINILLEPKVQPQGGNLISNNQSQQEEKKANVEKKPSN